MRLFIGFIIELGLAILGFTGTGRAGVGWLCECL